jgi:hypothetical protein
MNSDKENNPKNNSDNPFANAFSKVEKESVWNDLKNRAKPVSREEFLRTLEKLKQDK